MAVDSNLHEDVFISLLIELNRVDSERCAFKKGDSSLEISQLVHKTQANKSNTTLTFQFIGTV